MYIILILLWGVISLIMYLPHTHEVSTLDNKDKNIVIIIFIIGGPFFAIANILEQLLDVFMPPGWGDDDDY